MPVCNLGRMLVGSRYFLIPAVVAMAVTVNSAGPAPSGAIEGKITYAGTPPKMNPINMAQEPTCAKDHNPPPQTQRLATGPPNAPPYTLVYISAPQPPLPI